ncbi:cytochrome P450 [Rhizobium sp.]|jgi:cytochrome P450|uniref:cytochrome P450 n=1 Tax=Rhizobium sp. TaxID=391 RepID=UPI000E8E0E79|nr:cytochrome P450 [Rhizobium sp.]
MIRLIENAIKHVLILLDAIITAVVSLVALAWQGLKILISTPSSGRSAAFSALVAQPESLLQGFAVLRVFAPNLLLKKQLITAYPNSGTAIVTLARDVREVLSRDDDFAVVYAPKMEAITAGSNFFLGMQNTPQYTHDVSVMRLAIRREDLPQTVIPAASQTAQQIVASQNGSIDVPNALTLEIPYRMVADYFGTPGPSRQDMIDWTTSMFWYLFIDLVGETSITNKALDSAAKCRAYLDQRITERKAEGGGDDVLARCLALQASGTPGFTDIDIRNNMIGMLIGAVPTLNKAAVQALDQLMDRPDALAKAQAAARANDIKTVTASLMEGLRFNPVNPLIYRQAVRDSVIARSTLRARTVPQGTMVLACNLSAMFDPHATAHANQFRLDRPADDYILWGDGLHTCFGQYINQAIIPTMLMPLLKQPGLRRAPGSAGQVDFGGTPFPQHWQLLFG